jgi:hypothetical protein
MLPDHLSENKKGQNVGRRGGGEEGGHGRRFFGRNPEEGRVKEKKRKSKK